jgi:hypothetical protein
VRVVVVTPEQGPHHQAFAARLALRGDVVAVLHPAPSAASGGAVAKARRAIGTLGPTLGTLRILGAVRNPLSGWDWISAFDREEEAYFPDAAGAYQEHVRPLARVVDDINAPASVALVRELAPDAVVCLGGPIYREALIEAVPLMLNFHSGVSPLYNGSATILFAFANGHVHLCGGTLMTMSPVVDGGDVLAHFLPAVAAEDTPATLFMKTVRGAAETADRFLTHLAERGTYARCPQPPALFDTRSADFTVYQTQRIRLHLERRTAARFTRPEELIPYFELGSDGDACGALRSTVDRLLGLA